MNLHKKISLFLFLPFVAFTAHNETISEEVALPWFTGPLIATSATVIPAGHFNIEPYFFATNDFGSYSNSWKGVNTTDFVTLSYQLPIWVGLTSWADLFIQPTENWNKTKDQSRWAMGDFIAGLEFQLYQSVYKHKSWLPSIKIAIMETFPTGKYKNSSPNKSLTDLGGKGSYATEIRFLFGRLENIYENHFFRWRVNLNYTFSTNVDVKGIHAYGGGIGTKGTANPGQNFEVDLGLEYNLTRNWALALDLIGTWQDKTRFKGFPGVSSNGQIASNTAQSSIQYSIAPAIEYNFSANLGIIGGVWLTVAGKNSPQFYSGVIALNYFK